MKKFKISDSVKFHSDNNQEQNYITYTGRTLKIGSMHIMVLETIKDDYKNLDEILLSLGINILDCDIDKLNQTKNNLNNLLKELYGLGIIKLENQNDLYSLKQIFKVGDIHIGYKIIQLLSLDDPFVQVYKIRDISDESDFVIKIFSQDFRSEDSRIIKAYSLFCQEFTNLSKIHHNDFIYKLLDYNLNSSIPYGILEYIDGVTLSEKIEDQLTFPQKLHIITQTLYAMSHVHHNNIIHGDLHTRNFMVDKQCDVKIIDFGFSYDLEKKLMNQILVKGGQPMFTAPERVNLHDYKFSFTPSNKKSEIYQLGLIAYRILNGKLPFEGETWQQMAESIINYNFNIAQFDVDENLANILIRSLEKDPSLRFDCATEMCEEWIKYYK